MYIYIYMYRERETYMYTYIYIYIYIYTHIHIYIYNTWEIYRRNIQRNIIRVEITKRMNERSKLHRMRR